MDPPAGMLRLHPFSEEKTWVDTDFMQQLKAEMLEAAEEVGLPGGRWLVDGKPPQSVTVSTSGPSAPPASTQRPSGSAAGIASQASPCGAKGAFDRMQREKQADRD